MIKQQIRFVVWKLRTGTSIVESLGWCLHSHQNLLSEKGTTTKETNKVTQHWCAAVVLRTVCRGKPADHVIIVPLCSEVFGPHQSDKKYHFPSAWAGDWARLTTAWVGAWSFSKDPTFHAAAW